MSRIKRSWKAGAGALLGLAAVAFAGFAQAVDVVYSSEDFEGGTPCYSINGVNGLASGESWFLLIASTADSVVGTDYYVGATSRNGIVANGDPTDITPGGTEPTGQHAFVSTSQNRFLALNDPLTLASDNIETLKVSFSFMSYALDDEPAVGSSVLSYSALGDFSDEVVLASFGVGQATSSVETPDVAATEETWATFDMSFTEAGAGITFTDTAKIKIRRVPLIVSGGIITGTTTSVTTDQITFFDDVLITGVPGVPASFLDLTNFSYDASTGDSEVSIKGSPNTAYKLVEADDLDFSNPDQDPIPLTGATVGTLNVNEVTTDVNGDATVQFNLGTSKAATFLRAETP